MKKIIPIFTGNRINGKIKLSGAVRENMNMWVSSLKEGEIDLIVREHTKNRTSPQNAYYFSVVLVILADFFGYEKDEMHDEMKRKFNPVKSKLLPDVIIGGSTAKMSTEEFFSNETSYVNRIRRWAALEYAINIPDPIRVELKQKL